VEEMKKWHIQLVRQIMRSFNVRSITEYADLTGISYGSFKNWMEKSNPGKITKRSWIKLRLFVEKCKLEGFSEDACNSIIAKINQAQGE
jgi:hypothetical protein